LIQTDEQVPVIVGSKEEPMASMLAPVAHVPNTAPDHPNSSKGNLSGDFDLVSDFSAPDEHHSEASDISSMHHQLTSITGVLNSLERTMSSAMSRIETRVSLLESKVRPMTATKPPSPPHKRVLSGSTPIPLALVPIGAPTNISPPGRGVTPWTPDEVETGLKGMRYSPLKVVQKQLILSLVPGSDLSKIPLPLSRADWNKAKLANFLNSL
jgi:hypothetical protein